MRLTMCNICARFAQDCTSFSNVQYMCKIVLLSPMRNICARFAQDCTYFPNVQYMRKIVLISPMCNICARFAQDCTSFSNAQYMHKIVLIFDGLLYFVQDAQVAHWMCQCAIYAQDLGKILSQCAIYAQDLHKIVLLSPMRNICARLYFFLQCTMYAQDCTYFSNMQYMHKICTNCASFSNEQYMHKIVLIFDGLLYFAQDTQVVHWMCQCAIYAQDLRKILSQCAIYVQDLHKIVLLSPMCKLCARFAQGYTYFPNVQYMCKICGRLYLFPQCAIYAQDLHKIVLISPMCNTASFQYLHRTSYHPPHTFHSILRSQFIRICRICSNIYDCWSHSKRFTNLIKSLGFNHMIIDKISTEISKILQQDLFNNNNPNIPINQLLQTERTSCIHSLPHGTKNYLDFSQPFTIAIKK